MPTSVSAIVSQTERLREHIEKLCRVPPPLVYMSPVELAEAAGIQLDDWQAEMVTSKAARKLLNCSRQSGKSTDAAVLAVHTAVYTPGSLVLLIAPSLRQSAELQRSCMEVYRATERSVRPVYESVLRLELENKSRIVALPGKDATIRGMSGVDLLIIDEASRIPDSLYLSARPMLAVSGGSLVLLSTPFGTRGVFWEAYKHREDWDYYEIDATQCPRISPEFLEEEKQTMGEWWWLQEYMCKFMDAETAAFRSQDIDMIIKQGVEQWTLASVS